MRDDLGTPVSFRAFVDIDLRRPVDGGIVFLGYKQLAGFAVKRIAEAVAVEMHERFARLAAHFLVGQDHFIDAVVVPLVVRRHLVGPFLLMVLFGSRAKMVMDHLLSPGRCTGFQVDGLAVP